MRRTDMASKMILWKCDGCHKTLQGVIKGGKFTSEDSKSAGCPYCGCKLGETIGEVEEVSE
jgi:DNA-directed RNA polymerase subunit RPC12/RpoP